MNALSVVLALVVIYLVVRLSYIYARESYYRNPRYPGIEPRACNCNQGRLPCTCKPVCARCLSPDHNVSNCPHPYV